MASLEKAHAALAAAKALDESHPDPDHSGLRPLHLHEAYLDLLAIARVHAEIAQAEALEVIAEAVNHHVYGPARH